MSYKNIGAKRIVVGANYGLFEWIVQRATAVIMAFYTLGLLLAVLFTSDLNYEQWVKFFNFEVSVVPLGKILALLALLSLFYHAWVGVRDVLMDYIKPLGLRLGLQIFAVLWLVGSAVYTVQILWRI